MSRIQTIRALTACIALDGGEQARALRESAWRVLTNILRSGTIEERFNPNHDDRGRFASGGGASYTKSVDKSEESGIIEAGSDNVTISAIEHPIEQKHTGKGNPNAVLIYDRPLNNRQRELLDQLPAFDSRVIVKKNSVNMSDLSALTAVTDVEYAMFTKGGDRLIIRGSHSKVNIDIAQAEELARQGYRWSGHTHPGTDIFCLEASEGDWQIVGCFTQRRMVIYNSKGQYRRFDKG